MDHESENNKAIEESDIEEYAFTFNFINQPWDDRSNNSKIGIISFLIAIFVATMALVFINLILHYREFDVRSIYTNFEIECNLVKVDEYPFAARIHSVSTNELICIGAVVSSSSVLANELCLKSGPVRLRLGNPSNPRCKKGFSIGVVDLIPYDDAVTSSLVLLTSLEYIGDCIQTIKIGFQLDVEKELYIVGRPHRGGRTLSLQLAEYKANHTNPDILRTINRNTANQNKTICVQTFGKCPVRVGDLLVQRGRLFGLASTSAHKKEKTNTICFANLSVIYKELKDLDVDTDDKY